MRRTLRLPVALVAVVVVAEVAVVLLRPRDLGPEPVVVDARAYFSATQVEKGEAFRQGQLALYGAQLLIQAGVLVLLVRRPPKRLAEAARRPVLAGAATAAALSLALALAPLPVSAVARERARDVGLITQSWAGWAGDVAKSEAIGAAIAAAGGALLMFGMRRFGPRWWVPGAAVVVAFGVGITYVTPVVIAPLFNDFKALPAGTLRTDVLELARRAGVQVGEVYEIDASRRTTAANAYVAGVGSTKRVVLYDTLLKDFKPAETRLVVAHELGHVAHRDLPRGLLFLALVAPVGMLAIALLGERLSPPGARGTPAALPGTLLAIALISPVVTVAGNQLSRGVERSADAFSLELTRDPQTFMDFQRRIAVKNVSDPDPPGAVRFLLGTHPSTLQRLGQAEAFERRER